jgi:hypothetical protein
MPRHPPLTIGIGECLAIEYLSIFEDREQDIDELPFCKPACCTAAASLPDIEK